MVQGIRELHGWLVNVTFVRVCSVCRGERTYPVTCLNLDSAEHSPRSFVYGPLMFPKLKKICCGSLLLFTFVTGQTAETVDREALRFNDAMTKLKITRDQAIDAVKAKSLVTLSNLAKNRTKSNDAPGAMAAWRAALMLDREHVEARAFFTTAGTLAEVLKVLDAKPTDLLGLGIEK